MSERREGEKRDKDYLTERKQEGLEDRCQGEKVSGYDGEMNLLSSSRDGGEKKVEKKAELSLLLLATSFLSQQKCKRNQLHETATNWQGRDLLCVYVAGRFADVVNA